MSPGAGAADRGSSGARGPSTGGLEGAVALVPGRMESPLKVRLVRVKLVLFVDVGKTILPELVDGGPGRSVVQPPGRRKTNIRGIATLPPGGKENGRRSGRYPTTGRRTTRAPREETSRRRGVATRIGGLEPGRCRHSAKTNTRAQTTGRRTGGLGGQLRGKGTGRNYRNQQ